MVWGEPHPLYGWTPHSVAEDFFVKRVGPSGMQVWSEQTEERAAKPKKSWFFGIFSKPSGTTPEIDRRIGEVFRERIEREQWRQNQPRGFGLGPPGPPGEIGRFGDGRWDDTQVRRPGW